jgi:hypothetical protein
VGKVQEGKVRVVVVRDMQSVMFRRKKEVSIKRQVLAVVRNMDSYVSVSVDLLRHSLNQ